jgi:hypothetical protein
MGAVIDKTFSSSGHPQTVSKWNNPCLAPLGRTAKQAYDVNHVVLKRLTGDWLATGRRWRGWRRRNFVGDRHPKKKKKGIEPVVCILVLVLVLLLARALIPAALWSRRQPAPCLVSWRRGVGLRTLGGTGYEMECNFKKIKK